MERRAISKIVMVFAGFLTAVVILVSQPLNDRARASLEKSFEKSNAKHSRSTSGNESHQTHISPPTEAVPGNAHIEISEHAPSLLETLIA